MPIVLRKAYLKQIEHAIKEERTAQDRASKSNTPTPSPVSQKSRVPNRVHRNPKKIIPKVR